MEKEVRKQEALIGAFGSVILMKLDDIQGNYALGTMWAVIGLICAIIYLYEVVKN